MSLALLEQALFPLAVAAAGLPGDTTPEQVLARPRDPIPCYEEAAQVRCEALLIYRATLAAAERSNDARALQLRDAIVWVLMTAAHELAVVGDLLATVPVGCGLPEDWLDREERAERAFARFEALEEPVTTALRHAGLSREDVALRD